MTDRITALRALLEKVEAGEALPLDFVEGIGAKPDNRQSHASRAYHGSLDAAKALHEAVLPGWRPGMSQNIHGGYWYAWVQTAAECKSAFDNTNPARAWLIAILRALISMEEEG